MRPLTPAAAALRPTGHERRPSRPRSPCFMDRAFRPFRLQSPYVARRSRFGFGSPAYRHALARAHPLRQGSARRHLGFATLQQARHDDRPNRVRYPTDWTFTSRCSPPRLAATQLRSVTKFKPNLDRDFHPTESIHLQARCNAFGISEVGTEHDCGLRNSDCGLGSLGTRSAARRG